jgi:hypothetical protein
MSTVNKALSIRQPWAEKILNGSKKIEYRKVPNSKEGQRVYIYASLGKTDKSQWQREFTVEEVEALPKGVLVGTVEIGKCVSKGGGYEWHLLNPKRLSKPVKPKNQPQPVWFTPK